MTEPRDFRRVAIVNRGEPAMRLIHAVREMDAPMETVALYTDPDQRAMFVREADAAVSLGAATFVDPRDGRRMSSYLDYPRLERALVASGADAAWVGWGFVAEHPEFAELCERLGITFIGPGARAMRILGDKISAKLLAEEVGLPVAPWSSGPVETLDEARAHATRLGYPLMLKASSGGGGRGIRALRSEEDLAAAFTRPAPRRSRPSATARSSSSASSPAPATSRCRSSPTTTARSGPRACGTARSSAATRR